MMDMASSHGHLLHVAAQREPTGELIANYRRMLECSTLQTLCNARQPNNNEDGSLPAALTSSPCKDRVSSCNMQRHTHSCIIAMHTWHYHISQAAAHLACAWDTCLTLWLSPDCPQAGPHGGFQLQAMHNMAGQAGRAAGSKQHRGAVHDALCSPAAQHGHSTGTVRHAATVAGQDYV